MKELGHVASPTAPARLLPVCRSGPLLGSGAGAPSWAGPKPKPPAQSVAVRVLPQLAATGSAPEPAAAALTTVTAAFSPVTPGRGVVLEVQDGTTWVPLASGAQDASGRVTFNAPYALRGVPATYRVVAAAAGDLGRLASSGVRTDARGTPILL